MASPNLIEPSVEDHVANVEAKARELAAALTAATAAGAPHVLILPKLVEVFREAGMMP